MDSLVGDFSEISGWIGSIAFALSGLPQAIHSLKYGHARGITWGLLVLWWIGEWGCLFYVLPKGQIPLILNYLGNILFVGVITYYKIWERRPKLVKLSGRDSCKKQSF